MLSCIALFKVRWRVAETDAGSTEGMQNDSSAYDQRPLSLIHRRPEMGHDIIMTPEDPGTSLLRNEGLKTMIVIALGA